MRCIFMSCSLFKISFQQNIQVIYFLVGNQIINFYAPFWYKMFRCKKITINKKIPINKKRKKISDKDFSSTTDPYFHIDSTQLFLWSNERSWIVTASISTTHSIPQFKMPGRRETISTCCHKSEAWSKLEKGVIVSP